METLDLALLNAPNCASGLLATRFDAAARRGQVLRIESHDLDTEMLELAQAHGVIFLKRAALRDAFLDHRRAMMGVAQRRVATRGLLDLRQQADGQLIASVGPQLAGFSGRRYRAPAVLQFSPAAAAVHLDFATPAASLRIRRRERLAGHMDMNNRQFSREPTGGSLSFYG
jgi:hypothetical protein